MFNRSQNLPAVQTSTALAIAGAMGSSLIVSTGRMPKDVQQGVLKLMLAFPTQGSADADWRIMRDTYLEAVEGFFQAVVEWTLKFLLFNNPRNTPTFSCPPTPQDVREACEITDKCWERSITTFYFEGEWAKPSTNQMLKKDNDAILRRYTVAHRGGKPGEPDCIIPADLQIQYLRRAIEWQLPYIEKDQPRRSDVVPTIFLISDELLDRMPEAAFPDGSLKMICGKRAARAAAAVKEAEHQAYLKSLSDEARAMRLTFVKSDDWGDEDESEFRAEVDRRVAHVQAARLEAEKDGGEFLGTTFADGSEWREKEFQRWYRPGGDRSRIPAARR